MLITRKFDANASESLNTVTKVLMQLQLNNFFKEVASPSAPSADTKEDAA